MKSSAGEQGGKLHAVTCKHCKERSKVPLSTVAQLHQETLLLMSLAPAGAQEPGWLCAPGGGTKEPFICSCRAGWWPARMWCLVPSAAAGRWEVSDKPGKPTVLSPGVSLGWKNNWAGVPSCTCWARTCLGGGAAATGEKWGGGGFPRVPVPVSLNECGTSGFETQLCSFEPCRGSSQHSWCYEQREWALLLLLAIRLLLRVSPSARGLAGQPWGHAVI